MKFMEKKVKTTKKVSVFVLNSLDLKINTPLFLTFWYLNNNVLVSFVNKLQK